MYINGLDRLDQQVVRMHGLGRNSSARPISFGRWLSALP